MGDHEPTKPTGWVEEKLVRRFFKLVRRAIDLETTSAGRMNIIGTLSMVVIVFALAIPPAIEAVVKLFRPEAELGVPVFGIFALFVLALLGCVGMLAYLEASSRDR